MADLDKLDALIARVEGLRGPDREVDLALHQIVRPDASMFRKWNPEPRVDYSDIGGGWKWNAIWPSGTFSSEMFSKYTAYLDAAVALLERVLPGWPWGRCIDTGEMQVAHPDSDYFTGGSHRTPALALILATLRALKAKEQARTQEGQDV